MFFDTNALTQPRANVSYPNLGRFLEADPIGYDDGPNLYNYVGSDPVNFVDPLGLYRVCETRDTTHPDEDGTIVVSGKVECYDNGLPISGADLLVIDARNRFDFGNPEEGFFSVLEDIVITIPADYKIQCSGSNVVTYGAAGSSFKGGVPGHLHTDGFEPFLGPDDGVAARQSATGSAYMASPIGTYRIDRSSSGQYSASLIGGSWGTSERNIVSIVERWNQFGGQAGAKPASMGPSGTGKGCTRTAL